MNQYPFISNPDESEQEEMARRNKENQKNLEKRASEMLILAGENYEKKVGNAKMEKIETQHRILIQTWGKKILWVHLSV